MGAFATPAFADDTADVEVKLSGTTIAAGASGKAAFASLINNSKTTTATGLTITVDFSDLDTNLVDVVHFGGGCNEPVNNQLICGITPDELKPGEDFDVPVALVRKNTESAESVGSITISVETETTDPNLKNNTVTAPVTIGGNGPDLYVWADDVPVNEDGTTGSLSPGETGALLIEVGNQGDQPVAGFKVTTTLPDNATFDSNIVEQFPDDFVGCEFSGDKAVCDWDNLPLIPVDEDESTEDDAFSAYTFALPVKVADDAEAGVNLTGGVSTVEGYQMPERPMLRQAPPAVELPQGVEGIRGGDVDESDNTDEFTVFVKAADGNGGGGGLPVTGVQAGLLSGIGLAVVAAGGAMFLISRRRRVVLVTPGDEKPTA
ncbi:cell wall anchor protein [Polymorphospora sp. NPDC050346]|uniref:cell wall anchor protein n=1 Tax=Polymorphospora sp. NPDC050346 TaxID=3155780 RepID=UPI00341187A3